MHRAGHADTAEQERNKSHQIEKAGQIVEGVPQSFLAVGHRFAVPPGFGEQVARGVQRQLQRVGRRKCKEIQVVDAATDLDQTGLFEITQGDVHDRRYRAGNTAAPWRRVHLPDQLEIGFADLEAIARMKVELQHQRAFDQCIWPVVQPAIGICRSRLDLPIEGIIAYHGTHLGQAGRALFRRQHHRHEINGFRVGGRPGIEQIADAVGRREIALQTQIGAQ